jgi:hypothetical protein
MRQDLSCVGLLVVVGFGILQPACKREPPKPVVPMSAASQEARQQMLDPALPPGHPPLNAQGGAMPSLPPPAMAAEGGALGWVLPKGWSEARASGMRYATLRPAVSGKIDVSVIVLPGAAGGELGNVNRWRGQVGLPPVDDAVRARMRTQITSKAGAVSFYDFAGQGERMLAALLFVQGRSWFIKMTGDRDAVGTTRADFIRLLESLHFPEGK